MANLKNPVTAHIRRLAVLQPENGIGDALGTGLASWMRRVEALPFFEATVAAALEGTLERIS